MTINYVIYLAEVSDFIIFLYIIIMNEYQINLILCTITQIAKQAT